MCPMTNPLLCEISEQLLPAIKLQGYCGMKTEINREKTHLNKADQRVAQAHTKNRTPYPGPTKVPKA